MAAFVSEIFLVSFLQEVETSRLYLQSVVETSGSLSLQLLRVQSKSFTTGSLICIHLFKTYIYSREVNVVTSDGFN